ncbi:MAG TPA: SpoIIE family protein phosphatase [Anaerolineales bacterium]|nr:SpoIIE family protein phosphatase [Anaerolineales bacterium]
MKCIHCQVDNPATALFCLNCGSALISRCTKCHRELPSGARFCMNCGKPVLNGERADQERYINFAVTAPAPLVEKVRAAARLTKERRTVTAMFVDIVGSTALAEQVGKKTWTGIFNKACDLSCSVIYRYEGTIARLHADELLAFFGAPVAHEDDPVRAVRAALELLETLREYARGIRQEFGLDFRVRISLSTGPVIIGPIGSDLNYEYSALGGEINLAANIEAMKHSMTVLVSEYTYRQVAPFFNFTDLGEFLVESQPEAVKIYQVLGIKLDPKRARKLVEHPSPLIGRDAELASLLQLSRTVQAGLGRVAMVVSEPGLGKTRLISEWKESVSVANSKPPIKWIEGHNNSYDLGQAYNLLIDLIHSILGVPTGAGEPEIRAALRNLTEDLFGSIDDEATDSPALEVYPYLGHLLSLKLEGIVLERVRMLDPEGLRAQYLVALRRLLQGLVDRGPLIVVVENLQWADPSSIELLSNIIPLTSTIPLLFCLVTRPNWDAPGWKLITAAREAMGGRFTELSLAALSEDDSWQLVSNLLKSDLLPKEMRLPILSRAEGNPFFIEEVLRMLIDRGAIVQKDGGWVVEAEIETTDIPDNLHGLLLARIDSLSEGAKRTLRVASVIGRQFSLSVLEQVLGAEESGQGLPSHLGALESVGLTRVAQVAPELTYVFQSALVQEVAYNSLLEADRSRLHQAVGEALEILYPDQLDSLDLAPRLAQHFFAAGDTRRAFKYYSLAGDAALASYANREAESRYRKALSMAQSDSERATLLFGLGMALYGQSRAEESIQIWREGIDIHHKIGPESSEDIACLYARSARAAWEGGNTPLGLVLCQEGLEIVAGAPDSPGLALLLHEAARAYLFNGYVDEARRLCHQALEMAEQLEIVDVQVDALATMGLLPAQDPESALQALTRAVEIAESAHLLSHAARAHTNLAALLANRIQDYQAARDHYRRSAELRRLQGSKAGELMGLGGVAEVSLSLGDFKSARAILPTLHHLLEEVIDPGPAVFHLRVIEALLQRYQGDLAEAARRLRVLQEEERQRGNLQNLVDVNGHLAEVLMETCILLEESELNSLQEAEKSLAEARTISEGGIGEKGWIYCLSSMMCICQNRLEDARRYQDKAREAISRQATPINQGWLSLAEAKLATVEKHWAEALAAFEKTVGIFTKLQMDWWRARLLLDWAGVYAIRGLPADSERAQSIMREALAAFKEMGIKYYAEIVTDKLQALEAKFYSQALAHHKVAQEMARAGKLQEDFLPGEPPQIPGWQVVATLEPVHETSGDFYDFIRLPGGQWGILIADVADKGAGAALYMTLSRTLIRTFAGEYPHNPELVLTAVNQRILADTPANLFVTAFYGILDPATGNFVYCNAGHNPPYYLNAPNENRVLELTRTGLPLGIFEDTVWESRSCQLDAGDVLILYTDGVTEAQDTHDAFYGKGRLLACALSHLGSSAKEMQEAILANINDFSAGAPREDDLTLVILVRTHNTIQ